jgi:hypothetical protein
VINKNNAIFGAFLHCASGTCRDTPGVFTVKTGHEHIGCPGQSVDHFGANRDNLAQPGTRG